MPTKTAPKAAAKPAAKKAAKSSSVFSADEKAAMQEYIREKKAARKGASKEDGEREVLAKIAEMGQPDRGMAERIHAIIKKAAPELDAKTWYGMPAYAKDGVTICFFQPGEKFKARYGTLGFSDKAKLDEGNMWPSSFALTTLTAADETKIAALIKKAVG